MCCTGLNQLNKPHYNIKTYDTGQEGDRVKYCNEVKLFRARTGIKQPDPEGRLNKSKFSGLELSTLPAHAADVRVHVCNCINRASREVRDGHKVQAQL